MDVWLQDQQKALLYVALDHDMKSLLLECAFTWFRGGIQHCVFWFSCLLVVVFVYLFVCLFCGLQGVTPVSLCLSNGCVAQ